MAVSLLFVKWDGKLFEARLMLLMSLCSKVYIEVEIGIVVNLSRVHS